MDGGGPHRRHLEGRANCPVRRRTPTAPATRSRPGSRSRLGADLPVEKALEIASRCGAHKLAGRAAYDGQLTAADL